MPGATIVKLCMKIEGNLSAPAFNCVWATVTVAASLAM